MKCLAGFLIAVLAWCAAPPLEIVQPIIAQSDGGSTLPPGFTHVPGEVLFFSFQVAGFQKTADQKVRLTYTVDITDPRGIKTMETFSNEISAELAPQDKDWKPKVRMEIPLPPIGDSGTYRVQVKMKDEVAKTTAEKVVTLEVRGHQVEPSETPAIRNFRFYRGEDDQEPIAKAAYRPGDTVWARFDITGYKYGKNNAIDVVYGIAVLGASGNILWSQNEAAVERSESFYPKRWVPGVISLNLQPNIRPGQYAIAVQVKDGVGNQTCEGKFTFSVEP